MHMDHSYAMSTNASGCDLIEAVHAAGMAGCAAMNGLPAFSILPGVTCGHSRLSLDSATASSSTDCSSIVKSSCSSVDDDFASAYHQFSRTSHMGILDPSYKLFTSSRGNGSLIYKIRNGVVVVAGDPMCETYQTQALLNDFRRFRGTRKLRMVYVGASKKFAEYSRRDGCTTMQFGQERVLNPLTNPVLHDKSGKRIRSQCRQLLDQTRGNISMGMYCPSIGGRQPVLESQLQGVYDSWRKSRDENPDSSQAFITQYDLFSRPDLAIFIYTKKSDGVIVGLAGLRCLGANTGFQLDPCVGTDDAPRGVTDLLVVVAMQLLRNAGISYLSMGFEPFEEVQDLEGQQGIMAKLTRDGYRAVMQSVHAAGKRAYYDRFHPDNSATSGLFIVLPRGTLHLRECAALMRTANINFSRVLGNRGKFPGNFNLLKTAHAQPHLQDMK